MKKKRKMFMRLGAVVVLGACLYVTGKALWNYEQAQPRADANASIQVADLKRFYDLHVPSSYNAKKSTPVVFAFHGVYGDGKGMAKLTGFNQVADRAGFIVVYPDALTPQKRWAARLRNGPEDNANMDVNFVSALIDDLSQTYNLDRSRIYVAGFSNGGIFAHRLACELSDKVTAIASVEAGLPTNLSRTCQSTKPISVLMIHGTKDEVIPYRIPGKGLLPLADTVRFWRNRDHCSPQVVKKLLPESPQVRMETYGQCANQTNVTLYTIEGGEHNWGDNSTTGTDKLVKLDQAFNASATIWDFFSKHPAKSK